MRDILKEIEDKSYEVSISRLKKLEGNPMDFLDVSFDGNMYTRRGTAFESLLVEGKLPLNYVVVEGEEPNPTSTQMWSLIDCLSFLMLDGQTFEESFEEAAELSTYKTTLGNVERYFKKHKIWFLNYIEAKFENKECITKDQFEIISKMVEEYKKEPYLVSLLKGNFQFAVNFEYSGWKCKGHLDRWNEKDGILVDFKTTKREPLTVGRSQRYDLQGAFYKEGLTQMGFEVKEVYFVVCSTQTYKPHLIRLTDRDLDFGKNGGLSTSLEFEYAYGLKTPVLKQKEVKGFVQLLKQLDWHVENGFDKRPSELINNSNFW